MDYTPTANILDFETIINIFITIIIGSILGIIIGFYFFNNVKYIGPDSNKIVKKIFYDSNGKKYKYKPHITICPISFSMKKLHDNNYKNNH